MNSILSLAIKDLKLMARDKVGLFFIVGFPILMGVFFGLVMGGSGSSSSPMQVAVVDEDNSAMSKVFVGLLKENESVETVELGKAEAIDRVRQGKLVGVIVIPKEFGESAGFMWREGKPIGLAVDPSRSAEKGMLQGFVMEASGQLMAKRFQDAQGMRLMAQQAKSDIQGADDMPFAVKGAFLAMMSAVEGLADKVEQAEDSGEGDGDTGPSFQLAQIENISIEREIEPGSIADTISKQSSKWDITFPSGIMWGVLACTAGFAISIVRERKQGTMLRLMVAPMPRSYILAGKALACFLTVCAVVAFMVLLGMVLGMRPDNFIFLMIAMICVGFAFVGIMMTMSVIGNTEEAVSGAGWGACVVMSMFGGGMIPLAFMPSFMQALSNISPVKWGILALEGAIWRQFTLIEMLLPCGVLIAIGIAGFIIGLTVMRKSRAF